MRRVARGRVWTGRQAAARGLVDGIGGLDAAVADAKRLAGLPEDTAVADYPPQRIPPLLRLAQALRASEEDGGGDGGSAAPAASAAAAAGALLAAALGSGSDGALHALAAALAGGGAASPAAAPSLLAALAAAGGGGAMAVSLEAEQLSRCA